MLINWVYLIFNVATDISQRILEKLKKIVTDDSEYNMIVDLLQHEKRYDQKESHQKIKREFQLLINQHFPFEDLK